VRVVTDEANRFIFDQRKIYIVAFYSCTWGRGRGKGEGGVAQAAFVIGYKKCREEGFDSDTY